MDNIVSLFLYIYPKFIYKILKIYMNNIVIYTKIYIKYDKHLYFFLYILSLFYIKIPKNKEIFWKKLTYVPHVS